MSTYQHVSKKLQTSGEANDGDEDFISKLPESIMCHILSHLPTNECVRTSVLSKDWVNRWTSIYNIDVYDSEPSDHHQPAINNDDVTSFVKFMDKILGFLHRLNHFHLSCTGKYDASVISGWISAALKRNVESFQLLIYDKEGFVLPYEQLLNNTSLRKLILKCTFKVPRESYFPNLTYLHLYKVKIMNKPLRKSGRAYRRDRLVFSFPVLKTLKLIRCKWWILYLMEIHSPALSSFTCESRKRWVSEFDYCLIKIHGARLEKFEYSGNLLVNIDLEDSIVLNAHLNNRVSSCWVNAIGLRRLLKGFSEITSLKLSALVYQAMACARVLIELPRYEKLQRLVIHVDHNAELLLELLHSAPSLKFLEIYGVSEWFVCGEIDSVPDCVASQLEEVMFRNTHIKPLIHLATFLLKNGVALKKIDIKNYDSSWKKHIRNRLSWFQKASPCVGINFISAIRYIH